jgi:RNA polymerase sigma-70 factor (ECF subfamily)
VQIITTTARGNNHMPDESIVWERVREGDPGAFGDIFLSHRDRVYGQALRQTRSTHDAEDITALVFLEAWRRRSSVRMVDGSVIAWLLVCTNFVVKNAARTKRRHAIAFSKLPPQLDEADHADDVLARVDASGRESRLRDAFAQLSVADRDVLTLCVVHDFSLADAALALGTPLGTVKSRLSRAKKRLAALTGTTDWDAPAPAFGGTK